jgi:hypothetical protein
VYAQTELLFHIPSEQVIDIVLTGRLIIEDFLAGKAKSFVIALNQSKSPTNNDIDVV